jgi:hypothetical protein
MILNTDAVIEKGYSIKMEYYEKRNTKYQDKENACYHYLITFSNYSLKQTKSIYNYPTNNFEYVTSKNDENRVEHAISFNDEIPIWLISIGMGSLFISLCMILIENSRIKKRYANSKTNLTKAPIILEPYALYTIITIVISFLISLGGIYLGCFILNFLKYNSLSMLFFNGHCYLFMIGIALITSGISTLVLFRKKKTH